MILIRRKHSYKNIIKLVIYYYYKTVNLDDFYLIMLKKTSLTFIYLIRTERWILCEAINEEQKRLTIFNKDVSDSI